MRHRWRRQELFAEAVQNGLEMLRFHLELVQGHMALLDKMT